MVLSHPGNSVVVRVQKISILPFAFDFFWLLFINRYIPRKKTSRPVSPKQHRREKLDSPREELIGIHLSSRFIFIPLSILFDMKSKKAYADPFRFGPQWMEVFIFICSSFAEFSRPGVSVSRESSPLRLRSPRTSSPSSSPRNFRLSQRIEKSVVPLLRESAPSSFPRSDSDSISYRSRSPSSPNMIPPQKSTMSISVPALKMEDLACSAPQDSSQKSSSISSRSATSEPSDGIANMRSHSAQLKLFRLNTPRLTRKARSNSVYDNLLTRNANPQSC